MMIIDDRLLDEITRDEYWFLCHLAKRMRKNNLSAFPSIETICEDTKLGLKKVRAIKKSLEIKGIIEVKKRYKENGGRTSDLIKIKSNYIGIWVKLNTLTPPVQKGEYPPSQKEQYPPVQNCKGKKEEQFKKEERKEKEKVSLSFESSKGNFKGNKQATTDTTAPQFESYVFDTQMWVGRCKYLFSEWRPEWIQDTAPDTKHAMALGDMIATVIGKGLGKQKIEIGEMEKSFLKLLDFLPEKWESKVTTIAHLRLNYNDIRADIKKTRKPENQKYITRRELVKDASGNYVHVEKTVRA